MDDPHDDEPTVEMPAVVDEGNMLVYDRVFLGELAEISRVRATLKEWLTNCPVTDDLLLVASELAANAVLHSASRSLYFTVRVYPFLHLGHVRVEVEDLGGQWCCHPIDRPHGLQIVQMLSEEWGTIRARDGMRTTWACVGLSESVSRPVSP